MFGIDKKRSEGQGPSVTEEAVLSALRRVDDPDLHRDLVSLGMIKDLEISRSTVHFTVELTTPACPLKAKIEQEAKQAVLAVPGVSQVEVRMTANVRGRSEIDPRPTLPGVKHTVAVASGKGGVGKSTVSANLAVALAETGAAVGLLDADIYGPSIPMMMGVKNRQLEENEAKQIMPLSCHGIKLISFGLFMEDDTPVVWRGPMLGKALQQLIKGVEWGNLDYLVIDLPPGTGDVQLTLTQSVPLTGAVIVTTPQDVALLDVIRAIGMFQKVQTPILGLIENMSYFLCPLCKGRTEIFKHGGGRAASERLQLPFLGEIALDPAIPIGGDRGVPLLRSHPDSAQAQQFREAAGALAARISIQQYERELGKLSPTPLIRN